MHFETSQLKGWLIGDPHLGRDFRNGTPLHRRGEREAMQLEQFRSELYTSDVSLVVMVGDLFEKPFVPLPVINDAVAAVVNAATDHPDVTFVFLAGNHDKSRQLTVRGAWELFELAVCWLPNVFVINRPWRHEDVAFFPWQWDVSALKQVEDFSLTEGEVHAVVGHWDVISFGGDDSHLCPAAALCEKFKEPLAIYTGHYHRDGLYEVAGSVVQCTGSLQPYTHAEDPNGELYVTLTVQEALERTDLHDKCVRVILEPGETLPEIDCLQLTSKKVGEELVEVGEVSIGAFDIHAVLDEEFDSNEVPEPVRGYIKERIGALA